MHRIVVRSRIGDDGILHLNLPMGLSEADQEVQVTVEVPAVPLSNDEWQKRVLSTAGKWEGEFERPEQGTLEEREPLS